MKRLLYFTFISIICIQGHAQWNIIPSGTGAGYGSLFYKSGRLITYGSGATGLLISDDDGDSFVPIGIGTAINRASFSSINVGYAMARTNPFNLDSSPHITTDGGNTWVPIANPIQQLVHSIFAINDSTAIYGTSWGRLWKTSDGGNSFNYIHSDALITSTNGGKEIRKLHFISDNVGFASTGDLVMTVDGGLTWNIVSDTSNGSMNWYISDICFPSANIGYISGLNGLLAKTTDGGFSWNDLSISDSNFIYGIDFLNPNLGVILNSEKNILRTNKDFHNLMENRKKNAEERIKQMKNQALKDITNVSIKIAIESVEKLLRNSMDKSKLDKIYLSSIEETKLALKKKSS